MSANAHGHLLEDRLPTNLLWGLFDVGAALVDAHIVPDGFPIVDQTEAGSRATSVTNSSTAGYASGFALIDAQVTAVAVGPDDDGEERPAPQLATPPGPFDDWFWRLAEPASAPKPDARGAESLLASARGFAEAVIAGSPAAFPVLPTADGQPAHVLRNNLESSGQEWPSLLQSAASGNGDPDAGVATVRSQTGAVVTLDAGAHSLRNIRVDAAPGTASAGVALPYGLFSFTVTGLTRHGNRGCRLHCCYGRFD